MENAGRAVATLIPRLCPGARRVVGVVGAGNNGGDALVAVRTLAAWGYDVEVILVADRPADDPLLHGWPVVCRSDSDIGEEGCADLLSRADVILDGMLGTGSRGAPRQRQASMIRLTNASGSTVVALDLPSGVDGSTGAVPGDVVQATATVAFGAPKLGTLLHPGKAFVGRLVAVEIGFPATTEADAAAVVVTPAWAREYLPVRSTDTHKNRVGRVLVAGGQLGMAGAVVLAARAAFRSGAGLVRICSVPENRDVIQAAVPEAIFVNALDAAHLDIALAHSDAVVLGPGLGTGEAGREVLTRVLASGDCAVLLDADALNLVSAGAASLARAAASRPVLITPHLGEMARLLPVVPTGDRVSAARAAAEAFGCAVLLKGAPSIVVTPGGRLSVDSQGSSDLAVAGMGDTLAGVCGTLLAQGAGPAVAGSLGLYLSGRAAALAGRGAGLTPSDVAEKLPAALGERTEATTDLDLPFVVFDADPAR